MLGRVANNIYWMHRYRERAEDLARLIEVSLNLNIDLPESQTQWEPLLQTTGDYENFKKLYPETTKENVIKFLTFDSENPNSIYSSFTKARDNARTIREIISSEMWHELNTVYLFVHHCKTNNNRITNPHDFYTRIKRQCQLFTGISDTAMSHGEAWHFGRVGYLLERADMTSRILDVKYFTLLPSPQHVGTPYDNIQWSSLLKSTSALEMYRKKWQAIKHVSVVEFLLLDKEFPRSVYSCLKRARMSLLAIKRFNKNPLARKPRYIITQLIDRLELLDGTKILNYGLHEFIDEIQKTIIEIDTSIAEAFFGAGHRELAEVS
jgi:uncharacterized alpha-E superfamily protein